MRNRFLLLICYLSRRGAAVQRRTQRDQRSGCGFTVSPEMRHRGLDALPLHSTVAITLGRYGHLTPIMLMPTGDGNRSRRVLRCSTIDASRSALGYSGARLTGHADLRAHQNAAFPIASPTSTGGPCSAPSSGGASSKQPGLSPKVPSRSAA